MNKSHCVGSNRVLKEITRRIYQNRVPLPDYQKTNFRLEKVNNGCFAELWFQTSGCSHDRSGGCTMCNYGKGKECPDEVVLAEIKKTLSQMPKEYEEFIISPIGSMLDPNEVSDRMFEQLQVALGEIKSEVMITETRADTVTREGLERLRNLFHSKYQCVEIGAESDDDWILRNCVNKGCTVEDYKRAIGLIKDAGMNTIVNIGLGIPFMSERAAVSYTVRALYSAQEWGADSIVLFPYHVKPDTLMGELYHIHEYTPVSLWSLVEVLGRLDEKLLQKTRISWYRNYYKEPWKIIESPHTCEHCYGAVLALLDEYKNTMGQDAVRELTELGCACKEEWKRRMEAEDAEISFQNVERIYRKLATEYAVDRGVLESEIEIMKRTGK